MGDIYANADDLLAQDEFYRIDAARILQMCKERGIALELFGLAVLFKDDTLAVRAISDDLAGKEEVQKLEHRLHGQIHARGQDLIEIHDGHFGFKTVNFMHRTVRDFLDLEVIDLQVRQWSSLEFDVQQSLCEAYVLCACHVGYFTDHVGSAIEILAESAIYYARQIEHEQVRTPYAELDRLWRMAQKCSEGVCKYSRDERVATTMEPLLPMAVYYGLTLFLNKRAAAGYLELSQPWLGEPLLSYAICGFIWLKQPTTEIIDMLLRHGQSPNELVPRKNGVMVLDEQSEVSIWTGLLQILRSAELPVAESRLRACELFLAAGAKDPNTPSLGQSDALQKRFDGPMLEREILQRAFGGVPGR